MISQYENIIGMRKKIDAQADHIRRLEIRIHELRTAQAQHSVPEISGIGRDAEHPRAVVLYLRNEPSEEDMRAIQNFLRAISADVLTQALHSVPEASEQEKEQGWTLDYRFVERVTDLAASRTEYTTSMEATEQVLLAARELLAAAPGKVVSEGLLREARRHLGNWLELHECECEGGFHYCGREQVAKTHRELRSLLDEGKENDRA
ncbi:TPA: hypothetical protein SL385_001139 [Pseudomonas aeruginosa]|nr:hypothetical protein [Pseudomonas aeruginosa]